MDVVDLAWMVSSEEEEVCQSHSTRNVGFGIGIFCSDHVGYIYRQLPCHAPYLLMSMVYHYCSIYVGIERRV